MCTVLLMQLISAASTDHYWPSSVLAETHLSSLKRTTWGPPQSVFANTPLLGRSSVQASLRTWIYILCITHCNDITLTVLPLSRGLKPRDQQGPNMTQALPKNILGSFGAFLERAYISQLIGGRSRVWGSRVDMAHICNPCLSWYYDSSWQHCY
jgi:hypothetical protein